MLYIYIHMYVHMYMYMCVYMYIYIYMERERERERERDIYLYTYIWSLPESLGDFPSHKLKAALSSRKSSSRIGSSRKGSMLSSRKGSALPNQDAPASRRRRTRKCESVRQQGRYAPDLCSSCS